MRRWLFLPVDDRPITAQFPALIAPLGEIELIVPPRALLGHFLTPGDYSGVAQWMRQNAQGCEGAILSLDMLALGGLVASRSPATSAQDALARLDLIRELKEAGLRIFASSVVMRLGITGSSSEALRHHQAIHRWSQWVVEPERQADLVQLESEIPGAVLADYKAARERNHQVNRAAIELAAEKLIDFLLLLQEDCTPTGIHRHEQAMLQAEITRLGAGERVRLLPGTDEGALLLLSRVALLGRTPPAITPVYGREATSYLPAPFEDRPLRETVELQVEAAGARLGEGNITLFINTPVQRYGDAHELASGPHMNLISDGSPKLVSAIARAIKAEQQVALADVAFANGADARFTEALLSRTDWTQLLGYAAWNTAGNTLGTAVAMAILGQISSGRQPLLHQRALLIRLLDDYYYQTLVRTELNPRLRDAGLSPFNLGEAAHEVSQQAARAMAEQAAQLARLASAHRPYRLERFSARLPWPRTFEVELELELSQ
ncbi:MAG: DUF4127 family protein [Bacillota bacterium]